MPVFFVCAGLLGLLVVVLTVNVGLMRGRKKIYLGDGGDPEMLAAIRAHANLIEFAPLCLLLIYMASDFYGFWMIGRPVARAAARPRAACRRHARLSSRIGRFAGRQRHDDCSWRSPRSCSSSSGFNLRQY